MKKIIVVAGARPNFMKIAPIVRALDRSALLEYRIVHTGQHYDENMSRVFFDELGIPPPHCNLQIGSGSPAVQTAAIMVGFEEVCLRERPDIVLVVGDVNSTIACGLVAKKLGILLAHVEAGLRSRDRTMPEEINRIATDAIADCFFTTEPDGTENLIREGHDPGTVHFVGHVMIDTLLYQKDRLGPETVSPAALSLKQRTAGTFACMTLHRPSNVDSASALCTLLDAVALLADIAPVLFPCHPRTKKNIEAFGLMPRFACDDGVSPVGRGIRLLEPLSYNDFLYLWKDAALVLTDSGGLQEETTALKIPCVTLRDTTERPITQEIGSNVVVGTDREKILHYGRRALAGTWKKSAIPALWDGKAGERIVALLESMLYGRDSSV
jgi:UDP-N-acetylglucosamine 2-epimerase (non-hydrolysing)